MPYVSTCESATFLAGQRSRRRISGIRSSGKPVRGAILSSGVAGIQPQLPLGGRAARQLDYARPSTHAATASVGQTAEAASDIHGTALDGIVRPLFCKGDETVGGRVFRLYAHASPVANQISMQWQCSKAMAFVPLQQHDDTSAAETTTDRAQGHQAICELQRRTTLLRRLRCNM